MTIMCSLCLVELTFFQKSKYYLCDLVLWSPDYSLILVNQWNSGTCRINGETNQRTSHQIRISAVVLPVVSYVGGAIVRFQNAYFL